MKKILRTLILLLPVFAFGQVNRIPDGTIVSKPLSQPSSGAPTTYGYYFDTTNQKWSDFLDTTEVRKFYTTANSRKNHFPIYVSWGGTRTNGIVTGGSLSVYRYRNSILDNGLVVEGFDTTTLNLNSRLAKKIDTSNGKISVAGVSIPLGSGVDNFKNINVSAASLVNNKNDTIVGIGNSITWGQGAIPYEKCWLNLIGERYGVGTSINFGVPGQNVYSWFDSHFVIPTKSANIRFITVMWGTNEANGGFDSSFYKTGYNALLDSIVAKGYSPSDIVMIQTPFTSAFDSHLYAFLDSEIAVIRHLRFVPLYTLMKNSGGGSLLVDGIHPTNTGHLFISNQIALALNDADATGQLSTGTIFASKDAVINGMTVGQGANKDSSNTAFGLNSLLKNKGISVTGYGMHTLMSNTNGSYLFGAGSEALRFNTTGNNLTAVGYGGLYSNINGNDNVAIGTASLFLNNGSNNTGIGSDAIRLNTTGSRLTGIGYGALRSNSTGYDNTANGHMALYFNTVGYHNTANGKFALESNVDGHDNTVSGVEALTFGQHANGNSAYGVNALRNNTADNNTAVGLNSSITSTTATFNSTFGASSSYSNISGGYIASHGFECLFNSTGGFNSGFGAQCLYYLTTGDNNTGVGYLAGGNFNSGNNNTVIGANSDLPLAVGDYQLGISKIIYGLDLYESLTNPVKRLGIGTKTPIIQAVLDLGGYKQGFRTPRMNTLTRDSIITTGAEGLEIYNTDTHQKEIFNGTAWAASGKNYKAGNNISIVGDSINFASNGYVFDKNGDSTLIITGKILDSINNSKEFAFDGLSFNSASTQTFTPSYPNDAVYEIGGLLKIKSIATDTLTYTVSYHDVDNDVQTLTYVASDGTPYFSAAANKPFASSTIAVKAGTSIVFTVALPSSSGSISYNIHITATFKHEIIE